MIITFCGHSDYVKNTLDEEKVFSILNEYAQNQIDFYLGRYGNFDSFAYSCAKKYKALQPAARLIFITPYYPSRKTTLIYDETAYPPLENVPPKFAISHRNIWMIEHADIVIAYITHSFGGAYKSYTAAKRKNKTIFNIAKPIIPNLLV